MKPNIIHQKIAEILDEYGWVTPPEIAIKASLLPDDTIEAIDAMQKEGLVTPNELPPADFFQQKTKVRLSTKGHKLFRELSTLE